MKILALVAAPSCKHHDPSVNVLISDYSTIMPPLANAVAQLLRGVAVWTVLKRLDKLELQEPSEVLTYQRRLFHNVPNH